MGELFIWWLLAEVLGIVVLPLAAVLGANLPDRGWGLARPLGLLALGWLVWFPLSVVTIFPYSRGWIAGTLVALAVANVVLLRVPEVRVALRRLVTSERGYLLAGEAVFAGAFALMGWERSFTPAVQGTEKPMDVAFLSAIWRAPHLPPPDTWLSGYAINYYYFGHFLMATVAKLLGTPPSDAFNTSVALVFALTATAVFAVATNLVAVARPQPAHTLGRAAPFGVASALLVLVLGNLNGAQIWWKAATTLVAQRQLTSPWAWWLRPALWLQYDWWSPSRVIAAPSYTINEFPAFSFILADLHAHVLALPFAGLALGVALNLLLARGEGVRAFGLRWLGVLALFLAALALGALYVINGWDLPTYLGSALLALAAQQWLAHGRRWSSNFLLDFASAGIVLVALSVLLYLPFYRTFTSPAQGIGLVPSASRSTIGEEFAIFGLPVFLVGSLLVVRLSTWAGATRLRQESPEERGDDNRQAVPASGSARSRYSLGPALVGACLALLLLWTALTPGVRNWPLAWGVLFLAASAALVLRQLVLRSGDAAAPESADRSEIFIWCLVGTAAALVAASEVIYLRDVFDGGNAFRMNTVFKLYYQAWLLLGVAGGPALAALLQACRVPLARVFHVLASGPALRRASSAPAGTGAAVALSTTGATAATVTFERAGVDDQLAFSHARRVDTAPGTGGEAAVSSQAPLGHRTNPPAPSGSLPAGASPIRTSILRWAAAGGTLLWVAALVALLGAALVFPVQASAVRTSDFTLPHSLDGTAFMANEPLNVSDAAAIAWLNDPAHVAGNPVVLEATGNEYSPYGRVSAFTGLPTILGWAGHEWQWRANWLLQPAHTGLIERRQADIDQMYTNSDTHVVLALLARYHIRYVYVGAAERAKYPGTNLERFTLFLRVIYRQAGVTIYQVGR
jgi:YYY domain-containing protein